MCILTKKQNAIIDMENRGFFHDFHIEKDSLRCVQSGEIIAADDFEILEAHICTEIKYPGLCAVIYGIALREQPVKGILMTDLKGFSSGISLYLWSKLSRSLNKYQQKITS